MPAVSQTRQEILESIKLSSFSKKSIYLFCRGTKGKPGLIASHFNLRDTNITHVGVGYAESNAFRIYNVTDTKGYDNAMLLDSVNSFIAAPDVYYFSIWQCKTTGRKMLRMKRILKNYLRRKIFFDISFRLDNDDTLYCSEFCATVLNSIDSQKYHFRPVKKKLNDRLYSAILKRDEIVYYPVDFFRATNYFRLTMEFTIRN